MESALNLAGFDAFVQRYIQLVNLVRFPIEPTLKDNVPDIDGLFSCHCQYAMIY